MRPLLLLSCLIGCGGPKPRCTLGVVGDKNLAPQVKMLVTDGRSTIPHEVADGEDVPMVPPPQGGFELFVGASVLNMDACSTQVIVSLRDPETTSLVTREGRDVQMVLGDDGWAHSDLRDLSNVANINACPDTYKKDLVNNTYSLELQVLDRAGRTASVTHQVRLVCDPMLSAADFIDCTCRCSFDPQDRCGPQMDAGTTDF